MSNFTKHKREISVMAAPAGPALASTNARVTTAPAREQSKRCPKKIWIDLENSPHVPFFKPIIDELEARGHQVILTARDCFQVCELANLFQLQYRCVGHHYGKFTLAKLAGLGIRVLQLTPYVLREKPDLALSHGSRSLFLLSSLLKIPALTILDYEHARWGGSLKHAWVMAPEVVPDESIRGMGYKEDRILRYPGIKEDVYVPAFRPQPSSIERLGLGDEDLVVTIRPPATEAHYHNPESDLLLDAAFELIAQNPKARIVLLPRTPHQGTRLREQWPELFRTRKAVIPDHVIDGLDLIWASDLVISGGGTMNREAASMGVPVYSIFRGKTGAVDRYLEGQGRMVLIKTAEDVRTKIQLTRRQKPAPHATSANSPSLRAIVHNIESVLSASSSALAPERGA
ncbi:MAG TPA: DUF354 domain-containing protein [Terriglobales bacterium]|nr:DUF354 domain-containing protein [Terriglobales bacterium]